MLGEKPQPQARCLNAGVCNGDAALLSAAPQQRASRELGRESSGQGSSCSLLPFEYRNETRRHAREVRKNEGFCNTAVNCCLSSLKIADAFHLIGGGGLFVCFAQNLWKEH